MNFAVPWVLLAIGVGVISIYANWDKITHKAKGSEQGQKGKPVNPRKAA
jgi:hypothetical protein